MDAESLLRCLDCPIHGITDICAACGKTMQTTHKAGETETSAAADDNADNGNNRFNREKARS